MINPDPKEEKEGWDYSVTNLFILKDSNLFCAPLDQEEMLDVKVDFNRFLDIPEINIQTFEVKKESFIDVVTLGEIGTPHRHDHDPSIKNVC